MKTSLRNTSVTIRWRALLAITLAVTLGISGLFAHFSGPAHAVRLQHVAFQISSSLAVDTGTPVTPENEFPQQICANALSCLNCIQTFPALNHDQRGAMTVSPVSMHKWGSSADGPPTPPPISDTTI